MTEKGDHYVTMFVFVKLLHKTGQEGYLSFITVNSHRLETILKDTNDKLLCVEQIFKWYLCLRSSVKKLKGSRDVLTMSNIDRVSIKYSILFQHQY